MHVYGVPFSRHVPLMSVLERVHWELMRRDPRPGSLAQTLGRLLILPLFPAVSLSPSVNLVEEESPRVQSLKCSHRLCFLRLEVFWR